MKRKISQIPSHIWSGALLLLATIAALAWASSSLGDTYVSFWGRELTLGLRPLALSKPLVMWVNELLMAIFFLVVGLEIKKEMTLGALADWRNAALPVAAAVGGMLVPALLFRFVAHEPGHSGGWGVPMATDIAFALGCARVLGKRVPPALITFLMALAVIDDLGAVLVIALFYSSGLSALALAVAAFFTGALLVVNRSGVRRPVVYLLLGFPLWVALVKSGAHATIAGVVVGLCVPGRPVGGQRATEVPVVRLEHSLAPISTFAIVPIFALANAGVSLADVRVSQLAHPVSLGVFAGLFFGKPIGVVGASLVALKTGLGRLPEGVTRLHLVGAGLLAGVGFTMALFVASLAYAEGSPEHAAAKVAILGASTAAALVGLVALVVAARVTSRG